MDEVIAKPTNILVLKEVIKQMITLERYWIVLPSIQ